MKAEPGAAKRPPLKKDQLTDQRLEGLYAAYGPGTYDLPDQGYIARCTRWTCGCWATC